MAVAAATMAARTHISKLAGPRPRGVSPQASTRFRPERSARAPARFPGSSTAGGCSPMSPSDAAPRSRVRLMGTTEPLTAVHARSRPSVHPWTLFRSPSVPHLHAGAPRRPRRPGPPLPSRSPPPVTA